MKECRYCGSFYEDSLSSCPNCGGSKIVTAEEKVAEEKLYIKEIQNQENSVSVPADAKKNKSGIALVLGILAIAVVICIAIFGGNGTDSSDQTKAESNAAFEQGVACYNSGDYENAIMMLSTVAENSKHYDEAQSMLAKCDDEYSAIVVEKANGYAADGDYKMAINLLSNAGELLPNNAAIATAYDTIFTEYKGIVCSEAYSQAETFVSNEDYPSAITAIDYAIELVGHDDELVAKRDVYVDAYVSQTISTAKAQYIEYNYESIIAAEGILETALNVLPDNEILLAELANYKDREPVRLLDLMVSPDLQYNVSTSAFDYVGGKSDVAGITYNNSIAPSEWFENSHPYGWSETYSYAHYSWLLDYQYTKVTGTLFFSEDYKNASIEIELTITPSTGAAQTYFVSNNGQTQNFDVDLTGAKDFEIALRQSEINGTYAYLADVYVWK